MLTAAQAVAGEQAGGRLTARRPSLATLTYWKTALELALLVIAIPYLLSKFLTDPFGTARRAGEAQLG